MLFKGATDVTSSMLNYEFAVLYVYSYIKHSTSEQSQVESMRLLEDYKKKHQRICFSILQSGTVITQSISMSPD